MDSWLNAIWVRYADESSRVSGSFPGGGNRRGCYKPEEVITHQRMHTTKMRKNLNALGEGFGLERSLDTARDRSAWLSHCTSRRDLGGGSLLQSHSLRFCLLPVYFSCSPLCLPHSLLDIDQMFLSWKCDVCSFMLSCRMLSTNKASVHLLSGGLIGQKYSWAWLAWLAAKHRLY